MTYESGGGQSLANPSIDVIARVLSVHQATVLPLDGRRHAAVALLLRPTPGGPEMLFIERAECDGDPWSGDLGFPGGKVEPADASPRQAAEREVLEEIGVALEQALYLGRLDDISGAHLPIIVSCFVWSVPPDPLLVLSEEAVSALWVPLPLLLDPRRREETTVYFAGQPLRRPAIRLPGARKTVLWGITYRLVGQFLGRFGHPLPAGELAGDEPRIY